MNSTIVDILASPLLRTLVRPYTRRRKCIVVAPVTEVSLSGTYWDGGSRRDYMLVNMATGHAQALAGSAPPQFGGPREAPRVSIPEGYCVISTGVFAGRPAAPTIYLRESF